MDATARVLADDPTRVVEEWLRRYQASTLRLPRPIDLRPLVTPARGIVAALASGLGGTAEPGTPAMREAEKLFTFAGANFDSWLPRATAFDVCAWVNALRDTLAARAPEDAAALARLFDWLTALAVEGYAGSRLDALRARHRDGLEKGTPVLLVTPELPAALLVGEPERTVLDAVFGRLLLATARSGARVIIVDGSGLADPLAAAVLDALAAFAAHRKVASITTLLSGLLPAAEERWLAAFPPGAEKRAVEVHERFEDAVARAQKLLRERAGSP
jgi:hypothetical protein